MWLSFHTLPVDQDHKKQRAGQDWEIQASVKFGKSMTLIYNFEIFSSSFVPEYYSFFNYFNFPCVLFKYLWIQGHQFPNTWRFIQILTKTKNSGKKKQNYGKDKSK